MHQSPYERRPSLPPSPIDCTHLMVKEGRSPLPLLHRSNTAVTMLLRSPQHRLGALAVVLHQTTTTTDTAAACRPSRHLLVICRCLIRLQLPASFLTHLLLDRGLLLL